MLVALQQCFKYYEFSMHTLRIRKQSHSCTLKTPENVHFTVLYANGSGESFALNDVISLNSGAYTIEIPDAMLIQAVFCQHFPADAILSLSSYKNMVVSIVFSLILTAGMAALVTIIAMFLAMRCRQGSGVDDVTTSSVLRAMAPQFDAMNTGLLDDSRQA
ncbi:hypothetical protein SS50377_20872 [Spironucleus salmonicida]|uniref:Uncharacterized protein n=1 Tax=Spironucleus salmonicida TaxID=348837 RepID=V6LGW5_9EUKA|nr:hypothetical protein SS50377_20872 [Spironucleus salmonicida]|eukprot:EST43548.1 Hypothetical protein SS50377_16586 [Spironucleus salmonicida]